METARQRARWVPLVASLVLLVGLGAFGLSLVRSSHETAEEALGDGAVAKQRTVAALTDQYLQLAAKEAFDVDVAHPFELTPNSFADAAVLRQLIDEPGGFFDLGASLTDLAGRPLNAVGELPAPSDPGYGPLRRSLGVGEPGVSSLMWIDDVPVVAVGVPILRGGDPAAVLVAGFRADTSALQRYSEKLGAGSEGIGMVVDSQGTVVAARHSDLVGTDLAGTPAMEGVVAGEPGHARYTRDGVEHVVTWAPVTTGGWGLVEQVPARTFDASIESQSQTARLSLLGLLVGAGLLAVVLDHRTDRARRRGARRAEALVRDAHDVITIVRDGRIVFASPAMERVLGHDPADVVGRDARELVHPEDMVRVNAAVTAAAASHGDRQRLQARALRADGSACPCELVITNQIDDPTIRGTIVSMRDITELVALHDRLSHQALHDPLTELANRTQLERCLQQALTDDGRVAVLFLDLDGFKAVNDDLGHDRGDELLVQVASRLTACVRDEDTVARLGGDEFVIVLHGDDAQDHAPRVASRILGLLAQPFQLGAGLVTVGASIGIAEGGAGTEPDTLLREADAAMYLAKDRGRLRFEFPSRGLAGTGSGPVAATTPPLAAAGEHPAP